MSLNRYNGTVAYERANLARTLEYMRGMIADDFLSERTSDVDATDSSFNEAASDAEDREIMKAFTADGDEGKDEEIGRILESTGDLDLDGMLGLESVEIGDLVTEGTNWDLHKIRKDYIKPIKKEIALAKKAIKNNDAKAARAHLKDVKKNLQKIADVIKDMDNNMVEMAIGNLLPVLLSLITNIGGFCISLASLFNLGPVGAIANSSGPAFLIGYLGGMGISAGGPLLTTLVIKEKTSKYHADKNDSMDNGGWQDAIYKSTNVNQAWTYGLVKDLITVVDKMESQCNNLEKGISKNTVKGLEDIDIKKESADEDITSAISF